MWLAHRLVREFEYHSTLSTAIKYIVRCRMDHSFNKIGPSWVTELDRNSLPTLNSPRGYITVYDYAPEVQNVPFNRRCMVNDQFAAGPSDLMDDYASTFPDFWDFARTINLFRSDFNGNTNEALLTAHFHYRSAQFKISQLKSFANLHGCGKGVKSVGISRTDHAKMASINSMLGTLAKQLHQKPAGIS